MADQNEQLLDRVAKLEQEVASLRLRVSELSRPQVHQAAASGANAVPPVATGPAPRVGKRGTTQKRAGDAEWRPRPPIRGPRWWRQLVAPGQVDAVPAFPAPERPEREGATLERRIGGQVFAILGALIVVTGFALLAKVAADYGWFRIVPPGARCVGLAATGLAILVVGEWLRSRVRPIAVAGCNAAGLGGLFVAPYAAYDVFHLISPASAFALMASAAAIGLGVAIRHRFLSTAALSLVCAYLVPVVLAEADSGPYVLPAYLVVLSAGSLALAGVLPAPFARVRELAWVGSGLLAFFWTLATQDTHPWLVVSLWTALWAMHQAELLFSASRASLRSGESQEGKSRRKRVSPFLLSVSTTAGAVAICAIVLDVRTSAADWLAPASAFVASAAIALLFGGNLRVLRDRPRTDLEMLAAVHAATSGALLITTIALAMGGWIEVTAWLAMGLGAVVAGRWIDARSLEGYGAVLLGIATTRLVTYDVFLGPSGVPWNPGAPLVLAPATVLLICAGAAWMISAVLLLLVVRDEEGRSPSHPRVRWARMGAALAAAVWMFAPVHPEASASAVLLVWLGLSIVLRFASSIEQRLRLDLIGLGVSLAAIGPWLVASDLESWLDRSGAPGTDSALWLGLAVVGVLCIHGWDTVRRDRSRAGRLLAAVAVGSGAAVALGATSLEIARSAAIVAEDQTARRAAVSIWWGLWGMGLVVVGFWRGFGLVRYLGLALMSIAAAKAVLLDLAGVPPLWRVASFLALGAGMLGVAVLYGRVSAAIPARRAA